MKIAVDAMGGDFGPAVVVEGAVAASHEFGLASVLVGDKTAIEREITRLKAQDLPLTVRHASQVVGMAEPPSNALRRKRASSLRVAAELVKDGECGAIVSAGNTGAAMAISMYVMGVLPGVDRPAIAAPLPSLSGYTVLIDAGANVDPKPRHLFQFAVMGHVYSRDIVGKDNPRVGLLSVGVEEGKGNELTKEAYEGLRGSSLNFIGNIEGRDIYNGRCDVVVTDGFTGNVCLKVSESLAEMLTEMIRQEVGRDILSLAGAALSKRAFARMKKRVDYTEMGGAPLLGINGASIICHGASPVKAIKNAVRVAAEWVTSGVNEHIKTALEAETELAEGRERMVETSDEWIVQRTGIRERHIADEREAASDLALKAAQQALERAQVEPGEIDLIVLGTTTGDMAFPTTANIVQHQLGCKNAGSMDVYAACSGSIYSLSIGAQYVQTGKYKTVLCVGAECLSRITDYTDRGTCILLADAAGAAVVRASEGDAGILDTDLYSDGRYGDLLLQPAGGSRHPATHETVDKRMHYPRR